MTRIGAWMVLRSGSTTPLREVDHVARVRELDDRDRGLLRHIIGCETRRRATLRALVAHFARGKPSPDLAAHLRIGLAQLFLMDQIPVHAAVSETVDATTRTLGQSKGRYVNGVLRSALRARKEGHCGDPQRDLVGRPWHLDQPVFRDRAEHPYLWGEDALSMPSALLKRWAKRYGMETMERLARAGLEEPELSVRGVGIDREELRIQLAAVELPEGRLGEHEEILLLPSSAGPALFRSAPFLEGRVAVQGATALRAARRLDAQPGERVLDLCAAPGGKSAVLVAQGARVWALDVHPRRLAALEPNFERLGLALPQVLASDGLAALRPGETPFDAALVDVPCSNTGVLGARPGARWRFGPKSLNELVELGGQLLQSASERVRPGGRLVFSTCSLEPEENERQVQRFLKASEGWSLVEEESFLPAGPLDPGADPAGPAGPVDGGYSALLRREG